MNTLPFLKNKLRSFSRTGGASQLWCGLAARCLCLVLFLGLRGIVEMNLLLAEELPPNKVVGWGKGTNGMKAGLMLLQKEGKHPPDYTCHVLISNITQEVISQGWAPPVQDSRFRLLLKDRQGQHIAKTPTAKAIDKPLPAGLNIKEMRNKRGNLPGMMLEPNSVAHVAEFDVNSMFEIDRPGKYSLVVNVQLFRVMKDGALVPFVFPEATVEILLAPRRIERSTKINGIAPITMLLFVGGLLLALACWLEMRKRQKAERGRDSRCQAQGA
jgi:hypothetical protein